MNVPVGAHDIYDEEDFVIALTKVREREGAKFDWRVLNLRARGCCQLIASHLEVRRWLLKIDADFANMGVAYLDVAALPIVDEVRSIRQAGMCGESHVTRLPCVRTQLRAEWRKLARLHGDPHGTVWHHPDVQLLARAKLLKARSRFAPRSRARGACFS